MVCYPHRGWGGPQPLPVPAVLSIVSQMENGPRASIVASHEPQLDLTSLSPASLEELPGVWCHKLHSPWILSRKEGAGATKAPLQGLDLPRKWDLHGFESMAI